MGGNLITSYGIDSKRLSVEEYRDYLKEIMSFFRKGVCDIGNPFRKVEFKMRVPHHIKNKETFGDLDIVVQLSNPNDKNVFIEYIQDKLNPQFWHNNGPVSSFGYKNFQVDLIFTQDIDFHNNYLSWGDGGNLIGMFANRNGMKLSQDGLYYQIRLNETELLEDYLISKNWGQVLGFFDLSLVKWENGFNKSEELYQFLANSDFFQPDWFNPDDFNHEKRDREKKRPVFANFRNWIVENKIPSGKKFNVLPQIGDWVGVDLEPHIQKVKAEAIRQKELKKMFSERLLELNLSNEEKSVKIPEFKKRWDWPNAFKSWEDIKIVDFLSSNFS